MNRSVLIRFLWAVFVAANSLLVTFNDCQTTFASSSVTLDAPLHEIHGIGISDPASYSITPADVKDWPALVDSLRTAKGPVTRVRSLLPQSTKDRLADDVVVKLLRSDPLNWDATLLKVHISNELTKCLNGPVLYDEEAFKGVDLGKEIKYDLARPRTFIETARLNRTLLSLIFPKILVPAPIDFQIVRVKVKAGQPVVLVLSSYRQCRWHVEAEKGAVVEKVILFGVMTQEVTGVDAPVDYHARYGPDGRETPVEGLWVHKLNDERYKKLAAAVRDLTDKDFASFQADYTAGTKPFVVTPGAK